LIFFKNQNLASFVSLKVWQFFSKILAICVLREKLCGNFYGTIIIKFFFFFFFACKDLLLSSGLILNLCVANIIEISLKKASEGCLMVDFS
jgi:hypothetical protein